MQQQQQPRWTPLVKREECLPDLPQDGEEDEVDELAGDEDLPWHPPPVSPRPHNNHHARPQEGVVAGPPPKKKLFGFELDGTGGRSDSDWSSHKTQR
jgi:hypothetical protein